MDPSGQPVPEGAANMNHYGPPCDLWSAGALVGAGQ